MTMICAICKKPIGDKAAQFYRDCQTCGPVHVFCDPCTRGQVHVDRVKIHDGRNPEKGA